MGISRKKLEQGARYYDKKVKLKQIGALSVILKFVYFQGERLDKKEIIEATVRNYRKHKLFCEIVRARCT